MENQFEAYFARQQDYLPWQEHSEEEWIEQARWHQALAKQYGAQLHPRAFISTRARLYGLHAFVVGQGCTIGADCLIREAWLEMGENCSVNSDSYLQGKITLGNDVRIAPGAKVIGMNHVFSNPEQPVRAQGLTHEGIHIGDDVWIGAGAIVLDGVTVGAHSVLGAGAVVTKSLPPYSIAVGSPAKRVGDRRGAAQNTFAGEEIARFGQMVRAQMEQVLAHYMENSGTAEHQPLNAPGQPPTTRAWCDTAELAAMFHIRSILDSEAYLQTLQNLQKPTVDYDVLTVGYALETLGSRPMQSFSGAVEISRTPDAWLDGLPWKGNPWGAGAEVDHYATALYFNSQREALEQESRQALEQLFGWLATHQNPATGLWGTTAGTDLHLPVNGFYRLARGSYAQFGVPVPLPERIIDSVLLQAQNPACFGPDKGNACDVLDIIHPLWLCARQTKHRAEEGQRWARQQITRLMNNWIPGKGFSFELCAPTSPTLQGTEMGLAILWYLCDYVGLSTHLGYRPKGVHRPEAAGAPLLGRQDML